MLDVAVLLLTLLALAAALAALRRVRRTTLAGPCCWLLLALGAGAGLRAAEFAGGLSSASSAAQAGAFLAGVATFLPAVSLLGAKRPQDRAWNLVVLTLGVLAALPALECLVFQRAAPAHDQGLRGWLLWALIGLTGVTYLPTRQGFSSLLAAAGQVLWLGEYLPLVQQALVPQGAAWGQGLCALAVLVAGLRVVRSHPARSAAQMWLDFRDAYGLFWALRVQERINDTARQLGWDYQLLWSGPVRLSDGGAWPAEADAAVARGQRSAWRGLLRRFVSAEWLAAREAMARPT